MQGMHLIRTNCESTKRSESLVWRNLRADNDIMGDFSYALTLCIIMLAPIITIRVQTLGYDSAPQAFLFVGQ